MSSKRSRRPASSYRSPQGSSDAAADDDGDDAPEPVAVGAEARVKVDRPPYDPAQGRRIIQASWAGTVVFTIAAVVSTAWSDAGIVVVVVSLVLFAVGTLAFLAAYARAVSRSRYEAIGMGGLFFLAGETAPVRVQALLLGSLGVQTAVALATASIRMYTSVAFGILVPMFGLGLAGLWGARHGTFASREVPSKGSGMPSRAPGKRDQTR